MMIEKKIGKIVADVRLLQEANLYPFLPVIEAVDQHRAEVAGAGEVLMFASCDYLGLSQNSMIQQHSIDAIRQFGTNTFGAQIYSGHTTLHSTLEKELAQFMRKDAALLFPSGMHANIGVIAGLLGPKDVVINDRLNHTSLFMGSQLSGAKQRNFRHRDMNHLESILQDSAEFEKRLIVTDGVFSADGDLAPIARICELAKQYNAIVMVDEAHAVGVIGAGGRGTCELAGAEDQVDIVIGTMSKAFGSVGGFVATSAPIVTYLRHAAPSYTSSRGSPPAVAAASLAALRHVRERGHELRIKVMDNVHFVLSRLRAEGFDCLDAASPSIPVRIGSGDKVIALAKWLLRQGILVSAMVPPTVPPGGGRLRLGITALHTQEDLSRLLAVLVQARHEFDF